MTANADSYCGIYCGACSIRTHGETGRLDGFAACLGNVPRGELACLGCKTDRIYAGCRVCSLRDCCEEKGIAHCVECSEYPCRDYSAWQKGGLVLPHIRETRASMETIRRDGLDGWMAAQKTRWSCRDCGASLSWYARTCGRCGRDLGTDTYSMTGLRKLVCRFMLPMVYRMGKKRAASRAAPPGA